MRVALPRADRLDRVVADGLAALEAAPLKAAARRTLPPVDLLAWLRTRAPGARWFFQDRADSVVVAADGVAAERPLAEVDPAPGERWWVRGQFDGVTTAVLPAIELTQRGGRTEVVVRRPRPPRPQTPAPFVPGHRPDFAGWLDGVDAVRRAARAGEVQKVVLARQTGVTLLKAVDPVEALAFLRDAAPGTFRFLVDRDGGTLVGASPERLVSRRNDEIRSEALAGTRPRGATPRRDAALADALRQGAKERAEQRLVEAAIERTLAQRCARVEVDPAPQVVRYAHVQHLRSRLRARRARGASDASLVEALHPTPAVCGTPPRRARAFIAEHEPSPRLGYAAPVGWIGAEGAEIAVALRCAWVRGRDLLVYVGAGLLADSDPVAEWAELDHKARTVRAAFGV